MEFIPKNIDAYAKHISTPESEVLRQLNRDTHAMILRPRMLSGHLQGKFLEMISKMVQPDRILEIGTYTGYSAICLAQGLGDNGILHTIDHNPELEDFASKYIMMAGLKHKIRQHIGEALDVLPQIHDTFDLAFIDADKENYIRYFDLVYENLRPGGVILADNVLWSGKVLEQDIRANSSSTSETNDITRNKRKSDPETEAIIRFNNYIKNHRGINNLLLPFRDGLMISIKI
jgi:caffeoyl-CoA O-methyltransferase